MSRRIPTWKYKEDRAYWLRICRGWRDIHVALHPLFADARAEAVRGLKIAQEEMQRLRKRRNPA